MLERHVVSGHAGRAASVDGMAPKSLPSDDEKPASAEEKLASGKVPSTGGVQMTGDKPAAAPDEPADEVDGLALELDDEDDEDLVVYTAQEAAGAVNTILSFVRPHLGSYKKLLAFVS